MLLKRLYELTVGNKSSCPAEFLRFAAHLVLVFRMKANNVDVATHFGTVWVADPQADKILEAYVQHLISTKKVRQIQIACA